MFSISDAQQQQQLPLSVNYDEIELHVKDERTVTTTIKPPQQHHHSSASVLTSSAAPTAATVAAATSPITNSATWQTMQPARIQSMVVQNDGTIILCDNDPDINVRARPSRIEVVEIVSPPSYTRGKFSFIRNRFALSLPSFCLICLLVFLRCFI